MSTITFDNTIVWDDRPALTLQDVFQMYAALGGVHDTEFETLVSGLPAVSTWAGATGAWSDEEGYLQGVAPSAAFTVAWWGELPSSFVVEVESLGEAAYLTFRGEGDTFYALKLLPNDVSFWSVAGGVETKISAIVFSDLISVAGNIRLAVRETTTSSYEADRWLAMSVWLDDRLLLSHMVNIPTTVPALKFGLAAADSNTVQYASVEVPDLYDIVPYASIDPNEVPWGGISRALADKVVKSFVRYDGRLRAWVPKAKDLDQAYTLSGGTTISYERDVRELASRVRLYYALAWVEVFDEELLESYGHRFLEVNSAIIEAKDEAIKEARATLRRLKEEAQRFNMDTVMAGPFVEVEDRLALPDGEDYLVDSFTQRWTGARMVTTMSGRHYVFE